MSKYFTHIPKIIYNNEISRDITKRTKFIENLIRKPYLFLPYTVQDGEKPEDISYLYYGTVKYTWAVCLANGIYDYYNDWVLSERDFEKTMIDKYETYSGKKGYDVLDWIRSSSNANNILHYVHNQEDYKITKETYDLINNQGDFSAVRIYDYEYDLNEKKRNILLIDSSYITRIEKEFKSLVTA